MIKRLRLIESMIASNTDPTWLVMDVLPVTPLDRTDVTASFNSDGANYDHCGFIALINKSAVPVGSYYLCFNTESDIGYDWTGTSYPIILEQPDDE